MDYMLLNGRQTSCNTFVYQETLIYSIYSKIMCPQQWGKCLQQWGNVPDSGENVCNSGGNVCNSGEIEYALRNVILEIVIHKSAYITSEDR